MEKFKSSLFVPFFEIILSKSTAFLCLIFIAVHFVFVIIKLLMRQRWTNSQLTRYERSVQVKRLKYLRLGVLKLLSIIFSSLFSLPHDHMYLGELLINLCLF